jgi:DNA-binding transcriptional LysR family regulator
MSDIETRLFRYFVALAEERHFARAAERLGIAPPTLTHQIQKLESDLGAKLARRKGNRGVTLTETGRQFFTEAQHVLRQVEHATAVARQAERGEVGRIELGYMTSASALLQTWIGEFRRANPAIDIAMHRLGPFAQIAGIMGKELDAGFTRAPNKYSAGLRGIEVYRQRLVLALPGDHPLAQRKDIKPAMLRDETFVNTTPEVDVGFYDDTKVVAAIGNFAPRISTGGNCSALLTYVGLGYGIAVVPQHKKMNVPNVVFREMAGDPIPEFSIAFVYRHDPSPSAKRLIQHMQRHTLPPHRPSGPRASPS